MTNTTTVGSAVKVNGKTYTVTRIGDFMVELEGTRGGWASLVQSKGGAWSLVTERATKPVLTFGAA